MSSGSRSGNSSRTCSDDRPEASRSNTSVTRIRNPRTHGRPPHCSGFTVIRSTRAATVDFSRKAYTAPAAMGHEPTREPVSSAAGRRGRRGAVDSKEVPLLAPPGGRAVRLQRFSFRSRASRWGRAFSKSAFPRFSVSTESKNALAESRCRLPWPSFPTTRQSTGARAGSRSPSRWRPLRSSARRRASSNLNDLVEPLADLHEQRS